MTDLYAVKKLKGKLELESFSDHSIAYTFWYIMFYLYKNHIK